MERTLDVFLVRSYLKRSRESDRLPIERRHVDAVLGAKFPDESRKIPCSEGISTRLLHRRRASLG